MSTNNVLATVGNVEITKENLKFVMQQLDHNTINKFDPQHINEEILQHLINQELFLLNALDTNLDKDEYFIKELEVIKANALKQYAIKNFLETVTLADEEIQQYYNNNEEQFFSPDSVLASHILFTDEATSAQINEELNSGLSFEELASKYSICPSKENGGDLGWFTRGKMVKEFEDAAFKLEVGEISSPVKTQFGYHLIKLVDKKSGAKRTFEEVKDQISKFLLSKKQEESFIKKAESLKEKYPVKIF